MKYIWFVKQHKSWLKAPLSNQLKQGHQNCFTFLLHKENATIISISLLLSNLNSLTKASSKNDCQKIFQLWAFYLPMVSSGSNNSRIGLFSYMGHPNPQESYFHHLQYGFEAISKQHPSRNKLFFLSLECNHLQSQQNGWYFLWWP